jgi:hypothetical protein
MTIDQEDAMSGIETPPGYGDGPPTQMMPPPQHAGPGMYGPQGYSGYGYRPRPVWSRGMTETKPFFLTSEFFACALAVIAMAIAVATADNFDSPRFWTLITGIVAAYVISRGIAKSGTKSRAVDPREDMDLFNRGDDGQHHGR